MATQKIPSKLLRALKILATMEPADLSWHTCFVYEACAAAIETAGEYCQSGRMEKEG